ncbi:MAG: DUF512 domain-containing protein [Lachnospiraceae bacterium]|nr:DUF512 domain-containing protein [Lachnospiraceae bacterium]
MENRSHYVKRVLPGSIAEELEIEEGDRLVSINDTEIEDIFDYQFLIQDTYIEVAMEKPDGEQWLFEVEKDADEDLGIEFENGLMDEYRHCQNKCVFCFIDQMPPGMRETLYFKDDDSRLSFLQGNYVTLTNMSDHDIERICRYRLSPINISFQTMNPLLRCRMLNNRFAGEALKKVDRLFEAGIRMNGQIVLCKGLNDGRELEYSIRKLTEYIPVLESVSVVPVGLTKYRQGLYPLEPFTGEDACSVIDMIEGFQRECFAKYGIHFIHASDEWYVMAGRDMPEEERYDGYLQLENGVGMLRLLLNEFEDAMSREESLLHESRSQNAAYQQSRPPREETACEKDTCPQGLYFQKESAHGGMAPSETDPDGKPGGKRLSIATGRLPYPYIRRMADRMMQVWPELRIEVYPITNDFFGESITVSGLLTGQDLLAQLKGKDLGCCLLLPENVLRSGEDVFLDDMRVKELEKALQVPINIVKSSGHDFVDTILRMVKYG